MKIIFDSEEERDVFIERMDDGFDCPCELGITDYDCLKEASCRTCWTTAIKSVEVTHENKIRE